MTTRTDPWTRLAHLWPLLALTRIPGTRRPWRAPELTGLQREERDAKLRAEKLADTATYAPGLRWLARPGVIFASPHAPLHVDVLDTLTGLWRQLLAAAAEFGCDVCVQPGASVAADPGPLLGWCREQARSQPDGVPVDHAAWEMLHVIERVLGEIWDGQRLSAECPWCHGGILRKPSWTVRMIPGGVNPRTGEPEQMPVVVCESGACTPPEADAGSYWRGNPVWPLWEWEWLMQRLEASDAKQAAL